MHVCTTRTHTHLHGGEELEEEVTGGEAEEDGDENGGFVEHHQEHHLCGVLCAFWWGRTGVFLIRSWRVVRIRGVIKHTRGVVRW